MIFGYYTDEKVEKKYLENIEKKRKNLSKKNNQFLEDLLQHLNSDDHESSLITNWRTKEVEKGTLNLEDIFHESKYIVLEILFGKELAPLFLKAVENLTEYPYTAGYYRRPIRSSNLGSHLDKVCRLMDNFVKYNAFQTSLMDFLTQKVPDYLDYVSYSDWLAVTIDNGNLEVIDFVKKLIKGDNSEGRLDYEVFQGIFKSHNEDLYKLTAKLLLAAKLQEGLRQAICESMDCGTVESFLYLLNIIDQHDLIRFSAVKRAVATWTGIGEDHGDRITKKEMAIIKNVLTDPKERKKLLKSKDNVELYLGLWATGFYDENLAVDYVKEILQKGEKHQRLVTSYYVRHLQQDSLKHQMAKEVVSQYSDQMDLVACYFGANMYMGGVSVYSFNHKHSMVLTDYFKDENEAKQQFDILKNILENIKKKSVVFKPCIFPWYGVELKRTEIAEKMGCIAHLTGSDLFVDQMMDYIKLIDTWPRSDMVKLLLGNPATTKQHDAVINLLADRSEDTRSEAYKIASTMKFNDDDYHKLEKMLRYKSGDLRANVLSLLADQHDKNILEMLARLLEDKKVEKRLGGLDIMINIMNDSKRNKIFQKSVDLLTKIKSPTSKEMILINQLKTADQQAHNNLENGFGLYNPDFVTGFSSQTIFEDILKNDLNRENIFYLNDEEIFQIFKELSEFYNEHSHREYNVFYSNEIVTLNQGFWRIKEGYVMATQDNIKNYPFSELWEEFYTEKIGDFKILYQLYVTFTIGDQFFKEEFESKINEITGRNFFKLVNQIKKLPYYNQIRQIISVLHATYLDKQHVFQSAKVMAMDLIHQFDLKEMKIKDSYYNSESEAYETIISTDWFNLVLYGLKNYNNNQEFKESFSILYEIYSLFKFNDPEESYQYDIFLMNLVFFAKAVKTGLIEENEFFKEIFERGHLNEHLELISDFLISNFQKHNVGEEEQKTDYVKYIQEQGKIIIDKVLEIELNRGDSPTFFSKAIYSLQRIEGIDNLVKILMALGKEKLLRSTISYYWSVDVTKKSVLSYLLRNCYPSSKDNAQDLKKALEGTDITEIRLIETAMYSSQWIPIIEEYLEWEGMASGCYYFQAHISDVDKEKEALFAKYTSIPIEDLALGAFDIDWFKSAYNELGEDRFKLLYNASKYISDGSKHSRARRFADAVNGNLTEIEARKTIKEKRDKNMVMGYGLIPLDGGKEDLLKRYQFLQQFLKESKKFGAQRRSSEAKAVDIALENLARNAGYNDVIRLIWQMETELLKDMEKYFSPASVGDITLQIQINDLGQSKIICKKDEKLLKSIPRKWNKENTVLEIREAHNALKDQYGRSKLMLEQAMEDSVTFYQSEMQNLMKNPVIAPLLKSLVMIHNQNLGFFQENGLITANGEKINLKKNDSLKIAHPLDLYKSGQWEFYQQTLFKNQIKQPFKQVFRELYIKTDDENGQLKSLRYAGHQIQPKKTVAVLKGRRWIADYENGLQKVYYKQNIIAKIYAMADWFSPADIEAPTLEWVEFSDRKTFKPISIDEVPDIIFSEVMRDVDLAVSVAHVGGVDPEASHSTIEMRKAIATFNAQLFNLQNISLTDNHIFITGDLGSYTIHLGSGVIHQKAGSQIAVLPVHGQHKGRIFLPFVDDDPKTAEITSKMLLFSEDNKIKDPFILKQIKQLK